MHISDSSWFTFRETIRLYASHLHPLVANIASKIAESLGLVGCSFSDWPCQFRMNRYNFTPETVGSSGVQIHTDSGFLTVLQEDESVGGLEVMDANGTFVAVDPLPGSLLVNLGDVAKVRRRIFPLKLNYIWVLLVSKLDFV